MDDRAATIAPELLTTAQAAALCGVSARHYQQLAAAGRIGPQPVRLGRAVRWPRAALVDWIVAGCPGREAWTREKPPPRRGLRGAVIGGGGGENQ